MAETVIFVADTKQDQRDVVSMALVVAGLAARVMPTDSGRRLITDYTRALQHGDTVRAIVMDPSLAVVGGKTCSIAVRCIEQALERPPVPILFVSTKPLDVNLKRVMSYVKNSRFAVRGASADSAAVVDALREMLA